MIYLLIALRKSGVGCHIVDSFIAAIMYADDLALMAPSRSSLRILLNICESYGNSTKTVVMLFGKPIESLPLYLNGLPITFESGCKYLGTYVKAGKSFSTCARKPLAGFLCSANSILNVLNGPSEQVLLQLLYSNCVPRLTYACEIRKHTVGCV